MESSMEEVDGSFRGNFRRRPPKVPSAPIEASIEASIDFFYRLSLKLPPTSI